MLLATWRLPSFMLQNFVHTLSNPPCRGLSVFLKCLQQLFCPQQAAAFKIKIIKLLKHIKLSLICAYADLLEVGIV